MNWDEFAEFPVRAPVVVRNDDGRWVYHHPIHEKSIETPCKDLERSMFWYYLTEIIEAEADEVKKHMEEDQFDDRVTDFIAIRVPASELRNNDSE